MASLGESDPKFGYFSDRLRDLEKMDRKLCDSLHSFYFGYSEDTEFDAYYARRTKLAEKISLLHKEINSIPPHKPGKLKKCLNALACLEEKYKSSDEYLTLFEKAYTTPSTRESYESILAFILSKISETKQRICENKQAKATATTQDEMQTADLTGVDSVDS